MSYQISPVSSVIDVLSFIVLSLALLGAWKYITARGLMGKAIGEWDDSCEWGIKVVILVLAFLVLVGMLAVLPIIISGFTNPEYWALMRLTR